MDYLPRVWQPLAAFLLTGGRVKGSLIDFVSDDESQKLILVVAHAAASTGSGVLVDTRRA